jgi:phage gp46-like protein
MIEQQGDVLIFQTDNDGDIEVINGVTTMTPGLENAAYLSLFGGNAFDTGSDGNPNEYWGNYMVDEKAFKYRSETQNMLSGLPAVTSNLKPIHDAVVRDLSWMIETGAATGIAVNVTMPGVDRVKIVVAITGDQASNLVFEENWLASIN